MNAVVVEIWNASLGIHHWNRLKNSSYNLDDRNVELHHGRTTYCGCAHAVADDVSAYPAHIGIYLYMALYGRENLNDFVSDGFDCGCDYVIQRIVFLTFSTILSLLCRIQHWQLHCLIG
jgi:hypothetical protein